MTMKVNLRHYQGKVSKKATIRSNDPRDPELVVRMEGVVIPFIDIKPSMNILFRGMADQLSESVLDLVGSVAPFHISGTETNLTENISLYPRNSHRRKRVQAEGFQQDQTGKLQRVYQAEYRPGSET